MVVAYFPFEVVEEAGFPFVKGVVVCHPFVVVEEGGFPFVKAGCPLVALEAYFPFQVEVVHLQLVEACFQKKAYYFLVVQVLCYH